MLNIAANCPLKLSSAEHLLKVIFNVVYGEGGKRRLFGYNVLRTTYLFYIKAESITYHRFGTARMLGKGEILLESAPLRILSWKKFMDSSRSLCLWCDWQKQNLL